MAEFKQTIVVRSDLKLGKGKVAAQAAHASLEAYEIVLKEKPEWAVAWAKGGKAKIVLKVPNEETLLKLYHQSKRLVPAALIKDAGITQTKPGTLTCFAAGPAPSEILDKIFSDLKLL
ncbi:MAG: peptidyl-tRNA hydrolase Pth2 [Candidatus Diapherotrites archaeon]|nr:peptidyl-tRNA hydrolase Pth2 [Candidatus Diapherotrites archaeon]